MANNGIKNGQGREDDLILNLPYDKWHLTDAHEEKYVEVPLYAIEKGALNPDIEYITKLQIPVSDELFEKLIKLRESYERKTDCKDTQRKKLRVDGKIVSLLDAKII